MTSRLAIVTGARRGIGAATARAFLEANWEVIGLDLPEDDVEPVGVVIEPVDVSHAEAVKSFFADLKERQGGLDALVNNAAIGLNKPLLETSLEEWDAVQAANLRSVYLTSLHAFPQLRARRGAIVNISSVHALATSIHIAAYAASKGGILSLTRAMALEFGSEGIRVNAVLPGAVDTRMLRNGLERGHVGGGSIADRVEEIGRRTILGRVGRPEEIARAVLFLADGIQSSYITGQAIIVDGGAMARLSTE